MEEPTSTTGTQGAAAAAPAQGADEIKNLKAEMTRKLGNTEAMLAELKRANEALVQQLAGIAKPAAATAQQKKLSDIMYEDPEQFAEVVKSSATEQVSRLLAEREEQQATMSALIAEFPELNQGEHELTKRAVEIYNGLSEKEKKSPLAYQTAVKSAALETGIRPKSKRTSTEADTFSLSGQGAKKTTKKADGELDPATEAVARFLNVDLSDPEVRKRLASNHGRKNWHRYE